MPEPEGRLEQDDRLGSAPPSACGLRQPSVSATEDGPLNNLKDLIIILIFARMSNGVE